MTPWFDKLSCCDGFGIFNFRVALVVFKVQLSRWTKFENCHIFKLDNAGSIFSPSITKKAHFFLKIWIKLSCHVFLLNKIIYKTKSNFQWRTINWHGIFDNENTLWILVTFTYECVMLRNEPWVRSANARRDGGAARRGVVSRLSWKKH